MQLDETTDSHTPIPPTAPFSPEREQRVVAQNLNRVPVMRHLGIALVGGGIAAYGLWRRGFVGALATASGVGLTWLAYEGLRERTLETLEVSRAITVNAPRDQLFSRWMDLSTLPTFMQHLESVEELAPGRSRWTARAIDKLPSISWEAELVDVQDNRRIHWRSLPGSQVHNEGVVRFVPAPGGRGTEVHARIVYRPPGGTFGRAAAQALNQVLAQQVGEDLRRFKRIVEIGEAATTQGQPHGML